ncbi:HK97 gp10 family phage protein [Desulforamulus aeronauticus]|uniref:Bacteriophage HK97-gp10, putative tail-component n=1 Tax=Desulforamulus aeronauticus DSM 10349 TaxID=1121421 RepID=A0A1M6SBY8_9FIRM|nr:HK97 gp10 family phage protein [Desulforamulus aeronauticus]SHK42251.1 Bacteriophage HK97-gp10, putative tail-component [Desulforamulus aeronauticus DSM 10349]
MINSLFIRVIQDVAQRRERAVQEVCLIVEADAKLNCPVETGTLRRSITHAVESDENKTVGSVGSNVEYAYWAERHTPYLETAVDQNQQIIINKIREVLTP